MTQPIRIEDAVIVENESGRVEEITSTYVVLRLWDMRRMIVPLTYFIEKPFQNWTRESSTLIGTVLLHVDFTTPVDRVRDKAIEIIKASPLWDGNLATSCKSPTRPIAYAAARSLASARSSGDAFDLRCEIREKLIDFLQREMPGRAAAQPAGDGCISRQKARCRQSGHFVAHSLSRIAEAKAPALCSGATIRGAAQCVAEEERER